MLTDPESVCTSISISVNSCPSLIRAWMKSDYLLEDVCIKKDVVSTK